MPEQGYDEHSINWVMHGDFDTQVEDWQHERPGKLRGETRGDTTSRICDDKHSTDLWCRLFLKDRRRAAQPPKTIVKTVHKTVPAGGSEKSPPPPPPAKKTTAKDAKEEEELTGVAKGLQETGDQADEASDKVGLEGAKKGGKKTVDEAEETADRIRDSASGDSWFPPGMLPQ